MLELISGYMTDYLDSRGVGQSTGQPTWTGAGEVDDLHEIVSNKIETFQAPSSEVIFIQVQWGLKSYPEVTSVLLIVRDNIIV
jgi:alpha/beta superfamily hydrolase